MVTDMLVCSDTPRMGSGARDPRSETGYLFSNQKPASIPFSQTWGSLPLLRHYCSRITSLLFPSFRARLHPQFWLVTMALGSSH
ncbi:rCG63666 [Rattus norvegicus]|uniref:RCG63666 n=1 Tax=Rattus norvegicus TaxID=10116 RepID=A6IXH1_RAT|nr:rCG63666 [Rattus norvegicus]